VGCGPLYFGHVERPSCVRGVVRGRHAGSTGHVSSLAYDTSRGPDPFRNLLELDPGKLIALRDAARKTYNYRTYERFEAGESW
jgi:hypothetical protein